MDNEIYEIDELEEEIEELEPIAPPKFVIETVLCADMQTEALKAVQPKFMNIFAYVCMGLCTAMFAALIVIYFQTKESGNLFYAALMLFTLAFMLYNKLLGPKKQRDRWENQILRAFGTTELHLTTEFYELSLIQTMQEDADNMIDAGYSDLTELKETETLFLLRCKNRQWFFLSKKGFRMGSPDSFRRFINERIGGN